MKSKIPCEIVQDLMPLFIEELTSEATNREMKKHLEECNECQAHYKNMKSRLVGEKEQEEEKSVKEINYLRKIRRNNNKKVLFGILSVLLLLIAATVVKLYVIGYRVNSYDITYLNTDESQLNFGGIFYDISDTYKGYRLKTEEDGRKELILYARRRSLWSRERVFNLKINLNDLETEVNINGNTVKANGTVITKLANDLYNAKNKYVGDMSSNAKIASILGVPKTLGNFTNSLQTTKEPYGWTMDFEKSTSNSNIFEERIKSYACVLIALIDNLGEVSWKYTVETEKTPIERNNTITEGQCTEYIGSPIKSFSKSPEKVQELLEILKIEY
ncbi:hypothetical protein acsn021_04370 [Anaerocolumna cellulosilytica]|uniref:Uncharacterized protein n=1 Tax=Anaerocolumna cellulosilytica TaxID=433286 RepID=A0A6S6R1K0_9FIRM|nr:DUF4825 domain-containing protein [Anaerocolumna cellulosilytica]MBB5195796.1 hypothetical protein [Anaerocolumna cellulosilytica]BCJ92868.1 hypothetical protein acsn021_04370 [Anaerocolumna cellulosilytica]